MGYPVSPVVTAEVDPISRIEGHLGIAVVAPSGTVTEAYAHGNLWRGFENFLLGRAINDAITFTQRICGVCRFRTVLRHARYGHRAQLQRGSHHLRDHRCTGRRLRHPAQGGPHPEPHPWG